MELHLHGKRAVVTGGSRGIGAAIAHKLAAEGASVLVVARDEAKLRETTQTIVREGGDALACAVDLREAHSAEQAIGMAHERFGAVDVLVNCAGATKRGDFFSLSEADWDDGFALKFRACVRMTRTAWPALRASQGSVLNIVGVGAWTPVGEFTIGGSVNSAMLHFTKAMAEIGMGHGVRVNALNPGRIHTERLARNIAQVANDEGCSPEDAARRLLLRCGIKRFGQPEEIADVAVFLLSAAAGYMHGALVDVDGGETRSL